MRSGREEEGLSFLSKCAAINSSQSSLDETHEGIEEYKQLYPERISSEASKWEVTTTWEAKYVGSKQHKRGVTKKGN